MVFYKPYYPLRSKVLTSFFHTTQNIATPRKPLHHPVLLKKFSVQFSKVLKQPKCKYSISTHFSNCNTPTQLRSHINRYLYKQPQPMTSNIVSALQACSDMAAKARELPPKKKDEIDTLLDTEKSITQQTFEIASELFKRVRNTPALDLTVYNAYLEVCVNTWQVEEVFKIYKDMRQRRYVPDTTTFKLMILCAVKAQKISQALEAVELGSQDISHSIYTRRRMKVGLRIGVGALCGGWLTITLGMLLPNVPQIEGMGAALTIFFCLRSGATGFFSTIPAMNEHQTPFDIHQKYRVNIHHSVMDDIYKFFYQYLLFHLPTNGNRDDLDQVLSHMKSKGLVVDKNSLIEFREQLSVKSNRIPSKNNPSSIL